MAKFPVSFKFKAIDRLSRTIDRVQGKFPVLVKAVRKASAQFNRLRNSTARFNQSLGNLGTKMRSVGKKMSIGLTAPLAFFGLRALQTSKEFTLAMNEVEAKSGATTEQMQSLTKIADELGVKTQFSATQAAGGMTFLAQAGFDAKQIFEAIPDVLNLAASSNLDLATAADISSNIMKGFGVQASEMKRVSDTLAEATANANVDMIQMGEAMKFVAPVASDFGLSLEESASAVGKLGDAGIQASLAGTNLRRILLNLQQPAKRAILENLGDGVDVVDRQTGEFRNLFDILVDTEKQLNKLTPAQQSFVKQQVFGARAVSAANILLKDATEGTLPAFADQIRMASGSAERMGETMQKGLPKALNRLSATFDAFQRSLIGANDGAIIPLINRLADAFESMSKLDDETTQTITRWIAFAAVLGPVLTILGAIAGAIAFLGAPIAALVAGISALTAGFVVFFDEIMEFLDSITNAAREFISFFDFINDNIAQQFGFGFDRNRRAGSERTPLEQPQTNASSSSVFVDFSNVPRGTRFSSQSDASDFDLNFGFSGAIQ